MRFSWQHLKNPACVAAVLMAWHVAQQEKPAPHIALGKPKPGHSYFFSIGDFGVAACEESFQAGNLDEGGGIGHKACAGEKQTQVAGLMARLAEGLKPEFVLSLGDNFYIRGVQSLEDPQFNTSFEDVYNIGALAPVPWHITVGDHDQRGNMSAMVLHSARSSRWRLPAPFHRFNVQAPGSSRRIEFVVVDSVALEGDASEEVLQGRRFMQDYSDEFAGPRAGAAHWSWLEECLRSEDSPALRIVAGHRPVLSLVPRERSEAERAVERRLRALLQETAKPGTPVLYINGHDHTMQHYSEMGGVLHYVVNGVGGMGLHTLSKDSSRPRDFKWGTGAHHGFIVHEIGPESMALHFLSSESGQVLHSFEIPLGKAANA